MAAHMSTSEVACTLRLVDRTASDLLADHRIARFSHPALAEAFAARWAAPGACKALTREEREALVELVARSDEVANLEVALAAAGLEPDRGLLEYAATGGALRVCAWLVEDDRIEEEIPWGRILLEAADKRQRAAAEWCLAQCPQVSETWLRAAAATAAGNNDLPLMDWLLAKADERAALAGSAAEAGFVDDEEGEDQERRSMPSDLATGQRLCLSAIDACDLANVQRLWQQQLKAGSEGPELLQQAAHRALASPTPDWQAKVEWLLSRGADLPPGSYHSCLELKDGAAVVERFKWLRSRGIRPDPDLALRGSLSFVLFAEIAGTGNVEMMRWLHVECDWDQFGATYTSDAWAAAEDGQPYVRAIERREWSILCRLRQRFSIPFGPPELELFTAAIRAGAPVTALQLLADGQCPGLDWAAAEVEALYPRRNRHRLVVLAWIREQRRRLRIQERVLKLWGAAGRPGQGRRR
ncbi:hypothetical protein HYH03_006325 [Edaphochlamys debaryana]|uniref:Uncharacterized protein n=1 Tax=Edaphochlamys debaryana TaxID=47281 RepID=A0A835Y5Z4_9CHLO|nr:hypothetical protein HYH03_006325 [Edaphochlamys debaryana]|eukprot:KAG2495727.1 hypothetical protein HYH03_006325 [Edaphochlamys debaryana]